MSAELDAVALVGDNIAQYALGSYTVLSIVMVFLVLMLLLGAGLELKYATVLSLPILAIYFVGGWFTNASYVYNIGLFIVSLIYAFAVIKLYGR